MQTVYIETSIPSYLTARPSSDIRTAGWQQLTRQWWEKEKIKYECFISELVIAEASEGHQNAANKRLDAIKDIPELIVDEEVGLLASTIMSGGGIPTSSEIDALHVATASIHRIDYFLTWNCRHINNATTKPIIRRLCEEAGYFYPEICTPFELLSED